MTFYLPNTDVGPVGNEPLEMFDPWTLPVPEPRRVEDVPVADEEARP